MLEEHQWRAGLGAEASIGVTNPVRRNELRRSRHMGMPGLGRHRQLHRRVGCRSNADVTIWTLMLSRKVVYFINRMEIGEETIPSPFGSRRSIVLGTPSET